FAEYHVRSRAARPKCDTVDGRRFPVIKLRCMHPCVGWLEFDPAKNMTRDKDANSPQRLALDLQRTYLAFEGEKSRADGLQEELNRMRSELLRVKSSAIRETDSRLHAEAALGESQERLQLALDAASLALWDCRYPFEDVYLSARW